MVTTFHTSPKLLILTFNMYFLSDLPSVRASVRRFARSLFVSHFAPLFNADPALASAVPVV